MYAKNLGFLVTSFIDILLKKNKDEKEVGNSSHSNICFDDSISKSQLKICTNYAIAVDSQIMTLFFSYHFLAIFFISKILQNYCYCETQKTVNT